MADCGEEIAEYKKHGKEYDAYWPSGVVVHILTTVWPIDLSPRRPGSDHVGFMVDNAALGQVFSANHSTDCSTLIIIHHPELVQ
jgi:hypothetical protein